MNLYCWIVLFNLLGASPSYNKKIIRTVLPKMEICTHVYKEATRQDVDPLIAISVAWHETRFQNLTSEAGAKGPMGVIPKYHCPKKGKCDYIKAGVSALKKFLGDDLCTSLAKYNRGLKGQCKKGRSEYGYAKKVIRTYNSLRECDYGC